ncbi:MAG: hypothetical protein WCD89_25775 [Anaerocolumna sp.]
MKIQENVFMNEKQYILITGYKDDAYYRNSLNRLTEKIYGFDFEQWYQNGYWQNKYIPYSLLYENEIVANVSVNTMEFLMHGSHVCPPTARYRNDRGVSSKPGINPDINEFNPKRL